MLLGAASAGSSKGCEGDTAESTDAVTDTASAAARASARASEAVSEMHAAARRCTDLRGASSAAAAESEACAQLVHVAGEREKMLAAQLGEVEQEATVLEAEHEACQQLLERRQAAQQADERALAEAVAQIDAERAEARRALSEAIRRLTGARGEAQRLEAELAANSRRAHLLSGSGEGPNEDETVAHLLSERSRAALGQAKEKATEAQAQLAALQAEEGAREAGRRQRLHAQQASHGRNAELAAADVDAAQASVDALHYRLDGKSAQAAVLQQQLEHAKAAQASEAAAREAAVERSSVLESEAVAAERAWALSKEYASRCLKAAHAATAASLEEMEAVATPNGQSAAMAGADAPRVEEAAAAAAAAAEEEAAAEEALAEAVAGAAADASWRSQLASAAAEAERWRLAAEELQFMQDVVVVELEAAAGGAVGNSHLRPRLQQLSQTSSTYAHEHPEQAPKVAAGAALLGAGLGLAALGPIAGTALAGAAGVATYARWTAAPSSSATADDGGAAAIAESALTAPEQMEVRASMQPAAGPLPAAEPSAEEAPAVEAPAEETPAVEAPAVETPAVEAPAVAPAVGQAAPLALCMALEMVEEVPGDDEPDAEAEPAEAELAEAEPAETMADATAEEREEGAQVSRREARVHMGLQCLGRDAVCIHISFM